MAVLFAITAFVLGRTPFGRMLYAIGGNEQAAYQSGINTKKIRVLSYIICGGVSAIAGILLAARTNSASPQAMMGSIIKEYVPQYYEDITNENIVCNKW